MAPDLRQTLVPIFEQGGGRDGLMIVGMGNPDRGDDGVGVYIADRINMSGSGRVCSESEKPAESTVLQCLEDPGIRTVVFLDAADFRGEPGEIRVFGHDAVPDFSPAVSTHQVPLSLLMQSLTEHGKRTFLIGIQPVQMQFNTSMSAAVLSAAAGLIRILSFPDSE
ncbi:hydrogenase maturation protease [bacterium]|nr:hydrogenase maturation protease [bacterium]